MLELRVPHEDELSALSALCLRSKAVWGYDKAFMTACVSELTVSLDDLHNTSMQIAEGEHGVIGMAQVALGKAPGEASLERLFIEPDYMGNSAGRLLFDWALETARALGAHHMLIEADPDAAPFYRHMGARDIGAAPSGSIAGRMLPLLRIDL